MNQLEGYEEVPDRIRQFFEKYPEGSLRCKRWYFKREGDKTLLVYEALAYRTPDDQRPGEGMASEPFPGKTNFTRDSELMNAETSAWGRALVALGFVAKKVASAGEVRNRQTEEEPASNPVKMDGPAPTDPKERRRLGLCTDNQLQKFLKPRAAKLKPDEVKLILKATCDVPSLDWVPFSKVDQVGQALTEPVPTGESDVPADPPELEPVGATDDVPFS